jgi:nucleoside 2-deoxyribosyltransferase
MAFRVFLSYGTDADAQVTAWRLQTLATAYEINVTVPQRYDVHFPSAQRNKLEEHVHRAIDQSDCVLAIITGTPGRAMRDELNYALSKRKVIVPILQKGIAKPSFLNKFRVFEFSPWNAGEVEAEVIKSYESRRSVRTISKPWAR